MKIAKEDYKHIASLVGIILGFAVCFNISKAGVEHDIAQSEQQEQICRDNIDNPKYFQRNNCKDVLWGIR